MSVQWTPVDYVTDAVAVASVSSPWWWPSTEVQIHQDLEVAVQILGLIWLVIQITSKVHAWRRGRNN